MELHEPPRVDRVLHDREGPAGIRSGDLPSEASIDGLAMGMLVTMTPASCSRALLLLRRHQSRLEDDRRHQRGKE